MNEQKKKTKQNKSDRRNSKSLSKDEHNWETEGNFPNIPINRYCSLYNMSRTACQPLFMLNHWFVGPKITLEAGLACSPFFGSRDIKQFSQDHTACFLRLKPEPHSATLPPNTDDDTKGWAVMLPGMWPGVSLALSSVNCWRFLPGKHLLCLWPIHTRPVLDTC